MWWRLSLFILLMVIIGILSKKVNEKTDIWLCNFYENKDLVFTINDKKTLKLDMGHLIKDGVGRVLQCKRHHRIPNTYDSDWFEIITVFTKEDIPINKIDLSLNKDFLLLIYSVVKNKKYHCLSHGKSGEISFDKESIALSNIKLQFTDLTTQAERSFCMRTLKISQIGW